MVPFALAEGTFYFQHFWAGAGRERSQEEQEEQDEQEEQEQQQEVQEVQEE
ncbi:hypothetical protein [Paenibacillus sp. LPE1-1-1.1]|uniref:hypothetical protein n=1 Tax=Paenibacillus sp. LPE1-1-1.1 TaxID=3135230 RepID=UPI00341D14EF